MKKKLIFFGVVVVACGLIYLKLKGTNKSQTQYQTEQAQRGTLVVSVTASGQVSTANSSPVTAAVSGVVKKILVQNDQLVKSGQPLVELDLDLGSKQKYSQAWSSYQSAKNNLDSAKTNLYTLQNSLFVANQKFINDAVARGLTVDDPTYIEQNATWMASEATYKSQQNVIAQSQTALNGAWLSYQQAAPIIYAPISGIVTGLSLQEGSVIAPSDTAIKLATIKTQAPPTASVNLTEVDISKVKMGDKATLTFDSIVGKTYTGQVISVDTSGTVASGVTTYPIAIKLDTGGAEILPNMGVSASIITQTKDDVVMIPTSAVQSQNGQASVRIMKNGNITSVNVETGISSDTQTEITTGIAEGDIVVTGIITATGGQRPTQSVFGGLGGVGGFRGRTR